MGALIRNQIFGLITCIAASFPVQSSAQRLSGTFIQLQKSAMKLSKENWNQEMSYIQRAQLNTIVIQYLKYNQVSFLANQRSGVDPVDEILEYADRHKMSVWLGLPFDSKWWKKWRDLGWLKRNSKAQLSFAQKLWNRYKRHSSFGGWYIPYETSDGDFNTKEISNLNRFFTDISLGLKKISRSRKISIAMSTFFTGKVKPHLVTKNYIKILKGSGLTHIFVQDGVGENRWETRIEQKVSPYLAAFQRAAKLNKMKVWGIAESFRTFRLSNGKTKRAPTKIAILQKQIAALARTQKTITFDFFNYMSPSRGLAQQILFENYVKNLTTTNHTSQANDNH